MRVKVLPVCLAALVVTGAVSLSFAALLGVMPGFPLLTYDSNGTTSYNATSDSLSVVASPIAIKFSSSTPPRIVTPTGMPPSEVLQVGASISDTGAVLGGVPGDDLVVQGQVDEDGNGSIDYAGTLLTGEIIAFGFEDTGTATDRYDFRFVLTGGSLASLFAGQDIGVTVTSENSNFADDFTVDIMGGAKGSLGPIPRLNNPPVCDISGPYVAECAGDITTVQLDGTQSSDPDGDPLTYTWTTDCPGGTFDDSHSATPILTIDTSPGCNLTCNITLTVNDGQVDSSPPCTTTVTINDTLAPSVTCDEPDVTIACGQPTDTAPPTVHDDCDPNPVVSHTDVSSEGSCPQSYLITRTWTATDSCDNAASCVQRIHVVDTVAPTIHCPADTSVSCSQSVDPSVTGHATATDNCDPNPAVTFSDTSATGMCPATAVITRTWKARDACGNEITCVQHITLTDTTGPSISCPANKTIECNESTNPSHTGEATATDGCDPNPTVTFVDTSSGTCPTVISRVWRATDACGNGSSCTQTITVVDNSPPIITCPANVSLTCAQCNDLTGIGTATATDNCDTSPTITYTDSSGGTCPRTITRTWTAKDDCNNPATCTQVIQCVELCPICDNTTIVVNQNVSIDFNTNPPTYYGDADLQPYFTYDRSGATADTWKAIFNIGPRRLLIKSGATIKTINVPPTSNNQRAPGIVIRSSCSLEIEPGGTIIVNSLNQPAGNILIEVDGEIIVNGTITNAVSGTNGTPGSITIKTSCGRITTGPQSRIQTIGQDHGGSDINISSCGPGPINGGNIVINGLVDASYRAAFAATISIDAAEGSVTIDGNNLLEIEAGTQRRVTSGVTVRSRRDPLAGRIKIQAANDITVFGNRILTTNPAHQNYGAVAIKPGGTNGTSGDGAMAVVSLSGRIVASDRAFDFANRFNSLNDITLKARGNIELSVTAAVDAGASSNAKPVVSTQAGDTGTGGANILRSYSGRIIINTNAQVLADFTGRPGANGSNALTSCLLVSNSGLVKPADANAADNSGVCAPAAPSAILSLCGEIVP